jgi:signal transduction histidine kinase
MEEFLGPQQPQRSFLLKSLVLDLNNKHKNFGEFLVKKLTIIIIVTILYTVMAKLSQMLAPPDAIVIPVWPPAGIALAAVLIFGNIALVAVFLGSMISSLHMFAAEITLLSVLYAAIPGLGGALQAYVGKFALSNIASTDNIFKNTRSVTTFILISGFITCFINPTMGTSTLLLSGRIPVSQFPSEWLTWWISDSVGVIAVTPTIIAWYQKWKGLTSVSQLIKLIISWALILMLGYIAFNVHVQIAYLFIPFAIWSAFQFEIRFSLLTALLISLVCVWGATTEHSLINTDSDFTEILLIQIFLSIIYLTILLINAILADREKAYNNLQLLNTELEQRVFERTKDLSESNHQLEIQKDKVIQAFEELKKSHARLMQSEKMASLGLLTAGVAHEIKNPLNAMSANMKSIDENVNHIVHSIEEVHIDEIIEKEVIGTGEKTETLIEATNEGIKRTADIIADLCAFSRDDEAEMLPIDIHKNIDSTLNLLSSEIKNNISVIKAYGDTPPIYCHPGKINQVIMNILINAIHALQSRSNSKITITTKTKDDAIEIRIADNGPGIKKEILDKIFVPFFTTKGGLGSGLGLFISSNIIKEHRGSLSVMSELGKGTEFIINLPIKGMR